MNPTSHRDTLAIETPLQIEDRGPLTPTRKHRDDAGFDLYAQLHDEQPVVIEPGAYMLIDTTGRFALPPGVVGLVCPRSGLAARHQIVLSPSPGVVDAGYRGTVMVGLWNQSDVPFTVNHGDRIAQLVPAQLYAGPVEVVDALPASRDDRNQAGFGSTGLT